MDLILSQKQLSELINDMNSALPYNENDPEMSMLDGVCDEARYHAAVAKRILKKYFTKHPEENFFDIAFD